MTKIKTIFLDMDGVITSFRRGVSKALDKPYDYLTMSDEWVFWNKWPDISSEIVDAICTTEFWQHLPWMHDGREILRAIMDTLGLETVYLLTTPMPNIESPTGKWLWVRDNLPVWLKRTIITQAPKSLFAQPDALLIDDKDENVEEFIEAGGQGILVPRPYNRLRKYSDVSSKYVRSRLEDLI